MLSLSLSLSEFFGLSSLEEEVLVESLKSEEVFKDRLSSAEVPVEPTTPESSEVLSTPVLGS